MLDFSHHLDAAYYDIPPRMAHRVACILLYVYSDVPCKGLDRAFLHLHPSHPADLQYEEMRRHISFSLKFFRVWCCVITPSLGHQLSFWR